MQKMVEALLKFIDTLEGDNCIFITQVDPDAIGGALGIQAILNYKGMDAEIFFSGSVGHPQNRCIMNKFSLLQKMHPIEHFSMEERTNIILVDSSLLRDGRINNGEPIEPKIVIDHHRGDIENTETNFIWVEEVGATCTLIVEALQSLEMDKLGDEFVDIATCLAVGIYTDTKSLVSAGKRDIAAYNFIIQHASNDDLYKLINYSLSESYFKNFKVALDSTLCKNSTLVTGLGIIDEQSGDDISTIADVLLRRMGITLVVVWGIVNNKIRISARTSDLSIQLEDYLKKRFGEFSGAKLAPDDRGEGGATMNPSLSFWLMNNNNRAEAMKILSENIAQAAFSE